MEIVRDTLTLQALKELAAASFGDMVKAVVDIDREQLAVNAELHSDLEALLLEGGSKQASLWGINLYPELQGGEFIEFDSMINVRPSQNNRSRDVLDPLVRKRVIAIVERMIQR